MVNQEMLGHARACSDLHTLLVFSSAARAPSPRVPEFSDVTHAACSSKRLSKGSSGIGFGDGGEGGFCALKIQQSAFCGVGGFMHFPCRRKVVRRPTLCRVVG